MPFSQPVPLFSSHFHLSYPWGAKLAIQEKVATDKQKRLRREKARKQMERQKRGASSSDVDEEEDDDDDDDDGSKEDNEDLVALQSVPDAFLGSSSGAGSSGVDGPVGAGAEESSIQKRAASSPLKGPSPKHPYATIDGD